MDQKMTQESLHQLQMDAYRQKGGLQLGPWASYTWRTDPKHLGFSLARYKFCAKMLEGRRNILEIGCGDAFGIPVVLQTVESVHGIDLNASVIEDAKVRLAAQGLTRFSLSSQDVVEQTVEKKFDAVYSLDVIEHIPSRSEGRFMENLMAALLPHGVCILGTPNISAQKYASPASIAGHVNLKSAEGLRELLERYFYNVFIFSMNDEVIHTGFSPMAHYLLGVGVEVKNNRD